MSSEKTGVLSRKWYLYLTEFFAGMSVMAVELGASRLLAPYFSSSQIVWTIIIGTIMIAMALGNVWGGRAADKNPDPDRLYRRMLVAAVWIAAIPFFGKLVIAGVSALLVLTVSTNFLIWAAFATCMIVFVFPLFLLGTVTPSLCRYTVSNLSDSGKTVGTLGAFNTIGSIIGTFVPTFVSIPAVGTAVTFLIFSGVLLLLALIYFISRKKAAVPCVISALLFAGCCLLSTRLGFAFWEKQLAYEGESVYNYLQVKDDGQRVALSTNVLFGVQSVYVKSGALTGMYYDCAMAAPLMTEDTPAGRDLLVLGMGTGTYASQCRNRIGNLRAEGVEIDERITALAHEYFSLPDNVPVTTYDGRAYLNVIDKKYDVIMVDAYQDITIPFQMSSREFFTLVKQHLKENGVMVVNMNMKSDSENGINAWLADTIAAVFPCVYTADVPYTTNRELFAGSSPEMLRRFDENRAALTDTELSELMNGVSERLKPYQSGGHLLTDDQAQVELLGMQVIDRLIQDELGAYREKFRSEGISGLLH